MAERRGFHRSFFAIIFAISLCAVVALWLAYSDLREKHAELGVRFERASDIRAELAEVHELGKTNRRELDGLARVMLAEPDGQDPDVPRISPRPSLAAEARKLEDLKKETRQLARDLNDAKTRAASYKDQLGKRQAELNQASIDLGRVRNDLNRKIGQANAIQKKLTELTKDWSARGKENATLKTQLAVVITERAKIVKERNALVVNKGKLETRVKNLSASLSASESEQNVAVAALTRQLNETKKRADSLAKQLADAKKQIADLKKQIDQPRKKPSN